MKETRLSLNTEMVRAYRADLKTNTRRPLKNQPLSATVIYMEKRNGEVVFIPYHRSYRSFGEIWAETKAAIKCPYGNVGDILIFTEAYRLAKELDRYAAGTLRHDTGMFIWYEADGPAPACAGRLRPARFMPSWMCRNRSEITGVKAERVQSITEEDAKAEGMLREDNSSGSFWAVYDKGECVARTISARQTFLDYFEFIYPGKVASNPWVWAIEFNKIK